MMSMLKVEVAFALPDEQVVIALEVNDDATVEQVISQSGILDQFPQIDLETAKIGIFSQAVKLSDSVEAGDRIEIYRPLTIDPMQKRRLKAKMQKKKS